MKKSFIKRKPATQDMALQITSMADIFMILLVFLLKNYATSITNITPTAHLSLPVAASKGILKETLKIEIAQDLIVIDQKPVTKLSNFEFTNGDANEDGTSLSISKILNEQRLLKPDPNVDSTLLVMADQRAPYSTIKRVVASAAQAGFVDLQLVVVEEE